MHSVTLTDSQASVARHIDKFARSCKPDVFFVAGLAGTGKTELLASVARSYPEASLAAPTGKASDVLRSRVGRRVSTIHSLLLKLRDKKVDAKGRHVLTWNDAFDEDDLAGDLLLLDEASMVDDVLAARIKRTGLRIVAFGDPGQLPPVNGMQAFTRPNATLHEIHRQALDSAIIRQAHRVRNGLDYAADGPDFRVLNYEIDDDELAAADIVLAYRNDTKDSVNRLVRRLRGFVSPFPEPGEMALCLFNAPKYGVYNGGVYQLLSYFGPSDTSVFMEVDGKPVTIPNVRWKGVPSSLPMGVDATTSFDFGYAITVHKSQGSEWQNVVLLDECCNKDRRAVLYTGITRSSKAITVVKARGA